MNKRRDFFLMLSLLFVISIAVIIPKLVGGELYSADFKNGYEMYVREGYTLLSHFEQGVGFDFEIEPHFIWRVTDEDLKAELYSLCREAKHYRAFRPESDVMLGTPPRIVNLPAVCLNTGDYGYRISILNWENYSGSAWRSFPIKNEKYGEPVLIVTRLELSEENLREDQTELNYIKSSDRGLQAYSTISQEHLDELLALASRIGDANAEIVWSSVSD